MRSATSTSASSATGRPLPYRTASAVHAALADLLEVLRYELRDDSDAQDDVTGAASLSGEELVRRFLEEFDAEEIFESDDPDEGEAAP